MITPRQAAELLGIRLDYMYRLISNGDIAAARINGLWFIPRSAVNAHLAKPRAVEYRSRQLEAVGA